MYKRQGNICAATAPNYWILLAARFISGLPHGAYFGVGSIVAERLADKGKGSEAVSIMIAGMTIANLFGVPLGTSLSTMLSWRATFLLVGIWGIVILYYIWRWVPHVEGLKAVSYTHLIHGKKEENLIETVSIRAMQKARYSTHNIGHYGLAFEYYTHFTSPIRRFPDMMVHRLLTKYINGGRSVSEAKYEDLCDHSSVSYTHLCGLFPASHQS